MTTPTRIKVIWKPRKVCPQMQKNIDRAFAKMCAAIQKRKSLTREP